MEYSVVIPAKNEQQNVIPLIEELIQHCMALGSFEIIYVDDGSSDATFSNAVSMSEKYGETVRVLQHTTCAGQSRAIYSGVCHAKGRYIITLDADRQNDPADIPLMVSAAKQFAQGADFCIAGHRKHRKDTPWKRFQSKVANRIRQWLIHDDTPDSGCGLKLIPTTTYLKLPYFDHMHRFLPALITRHGGKVVNVVTNHRERPWGQSKYNMLGRLRVGIIDLMGVIWLNRRFTNTEIIEYTSEK